MHLLDMRIRRGAIYKIADDSVIGKASTVNEMPAALSNEQNSILLHIKSVYQSLFLVFILIEVRNEFVTAKVALAMFRSPQLRLCPHCRGGFLIARRKIAFLQSDFHCKACCDCKLF